MVQKVSAVHFVWSNIEDYGSFRQASRSWANQSKMLQLMKQRTATLQLKATQHTLFVTYFCILSHVLIYSLIFVQIFVFCYNKITVIFASTGPI